MIEWVIWQLQVTMLSDPVTHTPKARIASQIGNMHNTCWNNWKKQWILSHLQKLPHMKRAASCHTLAHQLTSTLNDPRPKCSTSSYSSFEDSALLLTQAVREESSPHSFMSTGQIFQPTHPVSATGSAQETYIVKLKLHSRWYWKTTISHKMMPDSSHYKSIMSL